MDLSVSQFLPVRKTRIPLRPSAIEGIGEESTETHSTSETCRTPVAHAIVQINDRPKHMTSDEQQGWKRLSIYKVPAYAADRNRKAYWPQVVSFGLYHHGKSHLRPMENHKRRVRAEFLRRSGKSFEDLLVSLGEEAADLRASYDALHPKWRKRTSDSSADQFLELMITDGCFMLEILMYAAQWLPGYYEDSDPIFSKHGVLFLYPFIRRDMLLLENQLPMLVLNQLFAFGYGKEDNQCDSEDNQCDSRRKSKCTDFAPIIEEDECINSLILNFCSNSENKLSNQKCLHVLDVFKKNMLMKPKKKDKVESKLSNQKCLHVLDVFRKNMLMKLKKNDKGEGKESEETIRPDTELHEHGISFEKSDSDSLENISFDGGVLKLPMIVVHDDTESMFLNLIAFERSHVGAGNEVTSYIYFMDIMIDKGQDVKLLLTRGIINNLLESDEAAAKLFNSLATDVVLGPESSLRDVINKVREYCKKRRHKWRANFVHTHFRNPWVIASLIAAVLLFGLTIIQAVYTALSYYK